ncbi:MAG: aminotransferase class IV [Thauera sp.]
MCKDGVLRVPPTSHQMLPGITCDVVLELARTHGMRHAVREVLEAAVRTADELGWPRPPRKCCRSPP